MRLEGATFDPETIEILDRSLEDAWSQLNPDQRAQLSKAVLAERILKAAASGERDPIRLRTFAPLFMSGLGPANDHVETLHA